MLTNSFSVWRAISDPIEESPLAFCDIRTVKATDCVAYDVVKRGAYTGEAFRLLNNPGHRFYYLSRQRPHEVTLLKMAESDPAYPNAKYQGILTFPIFYLLGFITLESAVVQQTSGVPHTAFSLPSNAQSLSPKPRRSIEVRTLVVI